MRSRLVRFRFASLFLLSLTMIAYELAVMRCFAVGSWSNFGSMVISIALLGNGLAGTLITFLEKRVERNADRWLSSTAVLVGPAMAIVYVVAQRLPFNPVMITTDRQQYFLLAAYYALYALPFFIGALYLGVSFIAFRSDIHRLYFWNMLGSGLGGFAILAALYLLPPERLVGPIAALASLAALFSLVGHRDEEGHLGLPFGASLVAALALCASLALLAIFGGIRISEFKPITYARSFPDSKLVYHSYGPTGEFDAYSSSFFHIAPGLSDNASSDIVAMPENAFLGLYIDGDGPTGIVRKLEPAESAYFDYLPMAAPYLLLDKPDVLLFRLGGGIGAQTAIHHGARSATIVEPDPAIVHMLRDEPVFRAYAGDILRDPRIRIFATEPRAFALDTKERFDLEEIGLVDSVGLSQTGGNPVVENFLYTAEGIASYLATLKPGGILSITVWNRLTPPRNVPKLLATVAEALRIRGIPEPEKDLFVFDQLLSTATILVKNGSFRGDELTTLRSFCARMSFIPCYYPGMPRPSLGPGEVLRWYAEQLGPSSPAAAPASDNEESPSANGDDLLQEDLYYYTLDSIFSGHAETFYAAYPFTIRPATDDKPYYTAYVKPALLSAVAADIRELSEEWGYLLLVATLGLSAIFSLLIIVLPMIGRRRELFARRKGTLRVIAYYACLGLGYMMIEIFLIQRLTFFLIDPIFSNSVVITSMLVLSGIGSLSSATWRASSRRRVVIAACGIGLSCVFYLVALTPILNGLLGLGLDLKICVTVLAVAPAAFCLGIPFPTGLSALSSSRPALIPWAWGVNGALSVTGTVFARLSSISAGYSRVLVAAIALYALAAATFSGNEVARPTRRPLSPSARVR
jgi:SAM-dependent methyltransferase